MNRFFFIFLLSVTILGCSSNSDATDTFDITKSKVEQKKEEKASEKIDLENKGVGSITEVNLPESVDEDLVRTGEGLFKQYCTICHKIDSKFIGPALNGVLKRRSPEWVMNMILGPERMLRDDPLAKELFLEFNGSPMANQGLTKEEARSILEYFRTI